MTSNLAWQERLDEFAEKCKRRIGIPEEYMERHEEIPGLDTSALDPGCRLSAVPDTETFLNDNFRERKPGHWTFRRKHFYASVKAYLGGFVYRSSMYTYKECEWHREIVDHFIEDYRLHLCRVKEGFYDQKKACRFRF